MSATAKNLSDTSKIEFAVEGRYPGGRLYSDTMRARTAIEAMTQTLARQRYSVDGGDITVQRVIDTRTLEAPLQGEFSAALSLLSENEAMDAVVAKALTLLPVTLVPSGTAKANHSPEYRLRVYAEYFDLLLRTRSGWFDGIQPGHADDGHLLQFEDKRGVRSTFSPALALAELAEFILEQQVHLPALQVREFALLAGRVVNEAAFA